MNDSIQMNFVEKFENQSIYTFSHQDQTLFLVGDENIVGEHDQIIALKDLQYFIHLMLVCVDTTMEKIYHYAKELQDTRD